MTCCSFLSLMCQANDGVYEKRREVEAELYVCVCVCVCVCVVGGDCLPHHGLPSLSAIPTANYLLMSILSRIDSLHHHYHLVDEH